MKKQIFSSNEHSQINDKNHKGKKQETFNSGQQSNSNLAKQINYQNKNSSQLTKASHPQKQKISERLSAKVIDQAQANNSIDIDSIKMLSKKNDATSDVKQKYSKPTNQSSVIKIERPLFQYTSSEKKNPIQQNQYLDSLLDNNALIQSLRAENADLRMKIELMLNENHKLVEAMKEQKSEMVLEMKQIAFSVQKDTQTRAVLEKEHKDTMLQLHEKDILISDLYDQLLSKQDQGGLLTKIAKDKEQANMNLTAANAMLFEKNHQQGQEMEDLIKRYKLLEHEKINQEIAFSKVTEKHSSQSSELQNTHQQNSELKKQLLIALKELETVKCSKTALCNQIGLLEHNYHLQVEQIRAQLMQPQTTLETQLRLLEQTKEEGDREWQRRIREEIDAKGALQQACNGLQQKIFEGEGIQMQMRQELNQQKDLYSLLKDELQVLKLQQQQQQNEILVQNNGQNLNSDKNTDANQQQDIVLQMKPEVIMTQTRKIKDKIMSPQRSVSANNMGPQQTKIYSQQLIQKPSLNESPGRIISITNPNGNLQQALLHSNKKQNKIFDVMSQQKLKSVQSPIVKGPLISERKQQESIILDNTNIDTGNLIKELEFFQTTPDTPIRQRKLADPRLVLARKTPVSMPPLPQNQQQRILFKQPQLRSRQKSLVFSNQNSVQQRSRSAQNIARDQIDNYTKGFMEQVNNEKRWQQSNNLQRQILLDNNHLNQEILKRCQNIVNSHILPLDYF